jgi:programmed cell death 6-interacting protein
VQKNHDRAERDNDLIYHEEVPPPSTLAPIQETSVVRCIIPLGLENPKSVIGEDNHIFGDMLGWGAREAISMS